MKERHDELESCLLTWGSVAADLRRFEHGAARVLAREQSADLMDWRDRYLTRAAGRHGDPTLANVMALSSQAWNAIYTVHRQIEGYPRIWRALLRHRYESRLPWAEIDRRTGITERDRKVCMKLIRQELGVALGTAA
ncbi:MAG: hypothetical protein ISP90_13500 [Nevskia sp.]|nr:hypothetical protein [Nevskia sp.]